MIETLITVGITVVATSSIIAVIAFIMIRVQKVETKDINSLPDYKYEVPLPIEVIHKQIIGKKQKRDLFFNANRQSLAIGKNNRHGYYVGSLTDKNTRKLHKFLETNQATAKEIKKIIQVLNIKSK